jgi:molecular chaperone DnaK
VLTRIRVRVISRFDWIPRSDPRSGSGGSRAPSALWIDHRNRLYVGKPAKERSEKDPDNTCVEFKLVMGTAGRRKTFEASGRSMEPEQMPEQMSAEVLKSLRGDVAQRLEHDLQAAVITVPAAFELAACDATRQAAELAGLRHSLQRVEDPAAPYATA